MTAEEFDKQLIAATDATTAKAQEAMRELYGAVVRLLKEAKAAGVPDHLMGASAIMAMERFAAGIEVVQKEFPDEIEGL